MDQESKALSALEPFGIITLCVLIFLSCTCCLCFVIHVRFIWTILCPLQSLLKCCSRCANKFRLSHRPRPQTFSDLEKRNLGSKRALKVARRTNQSCELKDFHHISPRIRDFIIDIQSESRQVIYKKCGDQVSTPGLKYPEDPKIRPTFGIAKTHLVQIHQNQIEDSNISRAELRKSLFLERNTQTDSLLSEIQPVRQRAGSAGELSRQPLPRIRLLQEAGRTSQLY